LDEEIGADDGRSELAPADIAAKAERLPKGEPALSREAVLDRRAPHDQHVDSVIEALGSAILRQTERCLCCRGASRLRPRHPAGFKLGDDLLGDFLVEARPV